MAFKINGVEVINNDRVLRSIAGIGITTRESIMAAMGGASHDSVGTYAYAYDTVYRGTAFGTTRAGSQLKLAGQEGRPDYYAVPSLSGAYRDSGDSSTIVWYVDGPSLSGTWRCMGVSAPRASNTRGMTLWMRIS